jgi:anaerobic ribonucleoside-triphosphate reductase activating protein
MIVNDIIEGSLVDGEGLRTVIFFQGCPRKCPGCHNPDTQPYVGIEKTPKQIFKQLKSILDNTPFGIDGISLSGGDPLFQNDEELTDLLKMIKDNYNYSIWCWTGYKFYKIKDKQSLKYIDVLIDGPYKKNEPTNKLYRGSDNQCMYVKEGTKWTKKD